MQCNVTLLNFSVAVSVKQKTSQGN